jgi:hypothetical protein
LQKKTSSSRIIAVFETEYPPNLSKSIASSLQADNKSTQETTIDTYSDGDKVITKIESISVEKLLPVLDDILACQSLCEKTLNLVEKGTEG